MDEDTRSRLFNAKSGHYRDQVDERGKALWDAHAQVTEDRCTKLQADFERYRFRRYRDEEDRLYGKLRADMQAPRPEGAPAPAMPTMQDIRKDAKARVDRQHDAAMERVRSDGQAAIDKLIDQAARRDRPLPER